MFEKALYLEEARGELQQALDMYLRILKDFPGDRDVRARSQLHIGLCYEKLGLKEAKQAYQKVIADYPDQNNVVTEARSRLAALRRYAGDPMPRSMTVRKVWEGRDVDDCGEVSPDGRYLSYVDWETGHLALYEIATGNKRRLTHRGPGEPTQDYTEYALNSRWSPDGKQIVYEWDRASPDTILSADLQIIGLDGSPPRVLCSTDKDVTWIEAYDWSNDGKSILALREMADSTIQLVLISVQDASVKVVRELDKWVNHSSLSPDGRYIVYDCPSEKRVPASRELPPHDIYVVSVSQGIERPLVSHAAHDYALGWSPDGNYLLFGSDRGGKPEMWVVRMVNGVARGMPKLVRTSVGQIRPAGMGFSADGSFYYCQYLNKTDVYITVIDPATGKIRTGPREDVNRFVGSNAAPEYSPDGKYLAYISRREPVRMHYTVRPVGNVLCVRNLETGEEKEIRPGLEGFGFPKWSPDSRSVLVVHWGKNEMGLYRIDSRSGKTDRVLLTKEPDRFQGHDWSTDGESIYILRIGMDEQKQSRWCKIVRRDIESGTETELYGDSSFSVYTMSRSRDGRWLALMGRDGSLKVMPSSGGDPRTVHTLDQEDRSWRCLAWTADGENILMPKLRLPHSDRKWDLWRVPVDGGEVESLGLEMTAFWRVSAHPDGRRLAFSTQGPDFEMPKVWKMENFLPKEGLQGEASAKPTGDGSGMRLRKVADVEQTVYPQQLGLQGQISPDGKYLSCVDWETGDLAVFEVGTGAMHRVTNKGSWKDSSTHAENSIWSPDGNQIAYLWDDYRNPALCVINADGSNPRVVLRDTNLIWIDPYDWSPDGSSILTVLQRKDHTSAISLVSTADGSTREILESLSGNWRDMPVSMSISPDGKQIVYDLRVDEKVKGHDIFVVSIGDGQHVPLATHPADDYVLGWNRDGGEILFASSRTGTYGLYAIPMQGAKAQGEPRLVMPDIGPIRPEGFTRNGSLYYHPPFGNTPDVYTVKYDPAGGRVVGHPQKIVADIEGTNITPDYSRCGKYLAYISGHSYRKLKGGNVLCIRSLETGLTEEFHLKLSSFGYPRWSRDSRSLYLPAFGENQETIGIQRIDALDGTVAPVVTTRAGELRGHLLANDEKSIILARQDVSDEGWRWRVTVRDLEGETEKELYRMAGERFYSFGLSPDGEQLAILSRPRGVDTPGVIIRVGLTSGGELKELCRPVKVARQLAWTADGNHILFCGRQPFSEQWGLWRVAAGGGEPEDLHTEMVGEMRHLTVHPDGTKIAFSASGPIRNAELWAIDNVQQELDIKR
jgi:Tol biopolymer transport system component